jgi:hypothetical protein
MLKYKIKATCFYGVGSGGEISKDKGADGDKAI